MFFYQGEHWLLLARNISLCQQQQQKKVFVLLLKKPHWKRQVGTLSHLGQEFTTLPMRGWVPPEQCGAAGTAQGLRTHPRAQTCPPASSGSVRNPQLENAGINAQQSKAAAGWNDEQVLFQ